MQTIEERILRTLKTSQQLQAVRILGETLQQQDRQAGHHVLVILKGHAFCLQLLNPSGDAALTLVILVVLIQR